MWKSYSKSQHLNIVTRGQVLPCQKQAMKQVKPLNHNQKKRKRKKRTKTKQAKLASAKSPNFTDPMYKISLRRNSSHASMLKDPNVENQRPTSHIHQCDKHQLAIALSCQWSSNSQAKLSRNSNRVHQNKERAGVIEWVNHLYCNDIRIKTCNELGELEPVVLHSKKKAIGIPGHELQRLSWGITFLVVFLFRRCKGGLLGRPFLLYRFKEAFHSCSNSLN